MSTIFGIGICDMPNCRDYPGWKTWCGMLKRVTLKKSYAGVVIDPDWLYFSHFNSWYVNHAIKGWQMDKDLMSNGKHDHYGPDVCVFLPGEINRAIVRHKGVERCGGGKWIASCQLGGKVERSEPFETEEEARAEYVSMKLLYLRFLADYYKPTLQKEVYEALYNYNFD